MARLRLASSLCSALLLVHLAMAGVPEESGRELQFEILGREVPAIMVDSGHDETQSGSIDVGFGSLVFFAITTKEQWKKFVASGTSASYPMRTALTAEGPDFSKDMVLAVGTFHVGGITGQGRSREAVITRIVERPDRLSVYVCEGGGAYRGRVSGAILLSCG